jgi:hypothetical protein
LRIRRERFCNRIRVMPDPFKNPVGEGKKKEEEQEEEW